MTEDELDEAASGAGFGAGPAAGARGPGGGRDNGGPAAGGRTSAEPAGGEPDRGGPAPGGHACGDPARGRRTSGEPGRARRKLPEHPVRLALLDLIAEEGTVTATQAAARLGHSSGLCSFHLRQLARHGLVEEAPHSPGRGGPRPWRLRWEGVEPEAEGGPVGRPGPACGIKVRMDSHQTDAYLRRIGAERPAAPDAAALRELHRRHLLTVPFENLSIHLGQDIVLTGPALFDKVVTARRGGFCYELNGAFAGLLCSLGFGVELLAARVFGEGGELGPPYDHMALRVTVADGGTWLADVGFGRHSSHPLDYGSREEQRDPGGVFRVVDAPDGDLDVLRDGVPAYRLEQRPRALADFGATCWYQRTSPHSHFRQSLVCSRMTEDGRVTLSGRKLLVTGAEGRREERELTVDEVLPAYREHFGVELDREPVVAPL